MSSEPLLVTVQDDVVLARGVDANAVIAERLAGVDWN